MARTRKVNLNEQIARASLAILAKQGYDALTPTNVARALKMSPSELARVVSDRARLIACIFGYVDQQVTDQFKDGMDEDASTHDRLFEVMMARFDILQADRAAFVNILHAWRRDLCLPTTLIPRVLGSMTKMLDCAGVQSDHRLSSLRPLGLSVVYAATLRAWLNDDSDDMAATMAELDKRLNQAGRIATWLSTKGE